MNWLARTRPKEATGELTLPFWAVSATAYCRLTLAMQECGTARRDK